MNLIKVLTYVLVFVLGAGCYYMYIRLKISKANADAKTIVEEANTKADNLIKEATLDAKTIAYEYKLEAEKEAKQQRLELTKFENKLLQREQNIDRRDISSPKCYDIEDELKKIMNIPVFHDDQHGTAIAALAALLGALKVTGKKIDEIKVVMNGAGAAGTAIARLLLEDGVKPENMTILNSKGILYDNGKRDRVQLELIQKTNPENKQGTFADAVKGADVLIGCSAPGVFNNDAIKTMADKSIVFAMANPVPEIMEEEAKEKGVYIYGSGRSDMHNQVNNSSVFPGLFRGALDVRARQINEEMKLAAAHALADLATKCTLDPDHVVVDVFDERVPHEVAKAVAKAAIASGVARVTELPEQYKD